MSKGNIDTDKPEAPKSEKYERGRGRHAEHPSDISRAGWLDILARTKQQFNEDNLSIVAAGVAFFAFIAVVPALVTVIAVYGLVADPTQVSSHIEALARVVPGEVLPLLREQMERIVHNTQAASLSATIGVLFALYSSANATKALITGLNVCYDETEKRGFLKLTLIAFTLTIGGIIGAVVAVSLLAVMPSVLKHLHVTQGTETLLNLARWPVLVAAFMFSLAVMYRFGPCRRDAKWRWVSWGAGTATVLWLIASGLFSLYVSKLGSYDKTYGPLGAVVVFMMWLYLSALIVLMGAELNSEMERQTVKDTTEGRPKPLGERGATAADTVGPARKSLPKEKKQ